MPQLPEQIRPVVAALAKYHFWILAVIVPCVLVPLLFMGTGSLDAKIVAQKSQIESRVSALKGVQGIAEHPNEGWSEAVEAQTRKIQEETLAEWGRFWESQKFLRAWPAKLGADFVEKVSSLKPGGNLNRDLLLRYQNTVPDLVRELPARMGADDLMLEGSVAGGGPEGELGPRGGRPGFGGDFAPRPGGMPTTTALVDWNAADQRRLFESFRWEKPPSTTQVLLAQEELWVYGLLCDLIKKANAGAAGAFNSPITEVEELAVGYPAAEDQPGGQGTGRIFMPAAGNVGGGEMAEGMPPPGMMPDMGGGMEGGAAGRPAHPRFGNGAGGTMGVPMMGEFTGGEGVDPAAAPAGSPDDALKEWIYVDFSGKPLTAAELASSRDAKLVHLMPFTLRVVMDQRKLDGLLADLASAAVPIDVRQVRINVNSQAGGGIGGGGMGAMGRPREFAAPAPTADGSGLRPYDVVVELRGSVGLAPPPDKTVVGGEQPPPGEGGA
jgi:hypothetical protein